ncbi:MAG: FHA domain-containing protein [Gemmataceae bacterium]|nr:FHA domain-containing protein [Gemmataceae bacterium]
MSLVGLEINGTRVRGVLGPLGDYPLPLPLEPPAQELPLALSLEKSTLEIGAAALRLLRLRPHLVCHGFLTNLHNATKTWQAGRHRLDAAKAMAAVWQRLEPMCRRTGGVVATLPGYLAKSAAETVFTLGQQSKVPMLGSLSAPLAAALVGYAEQTWIESALIVDVDDHALTLALVKAVDGLAHMLDNRSYPHLGMRYWKDRLVNALSDCCVLQSRRDPRDAPAAEQALYEQLDGLLEASFQGRYLHLGIQATSWYQNLLVQPEQAAAFCGQLTRRLLTEIGSLLQGLPPEEMPTSIVLTHAAGRLPGIVPHLRGLVEDWVREIMIRQTPTPIPDEDFGEDLMRETGQETPRVAILSADALARSAHAVGAWLERGDLPRGHRDVVAPLPLPQAVEAGPARLHFQGQEYVIHEPTFCLGSHTGCHLVIDAGRHPGVAGKHCEILHDRRHYVLYNRSQEGTLVNDSPVTGSVMLRAGDWIRLGARGPVVRFLGQVNTRGLLPA